MEIEKNKSYKEKTRRDRKKRIKEQISLFDLLFYFPFEISRLKKPKSKVNRDLSFEILL